MAERQISVLMESRYKSDLAKELRRDKRKIDAFQEHLKRRPLNIPVKLDLRGAMTQAAALRKAILGEFSRMPATILGADGRPATGPTATGRQMNKRAGVLQTTEFRRFDEKEGRWITERIEQVEQLGRGLTQVSKFKDAASDPFATITKDISNVQDLNDALRGMNRELADAYQKARGRGDKPGQIAALQEHKRRLDSVLERAGERGLQNSPAYLRAEAQISRVQDRIAALEGAEESAASKKARNARTREVSNQLTQEERRVQAALKTNKMEMDAAERITDRAKREAEVNRLYDERRKLFEDTRNRFRAMDAQLQGEGRPDLADRALRRTMGMENQANQATLDKQRAETDRMRAAAKEQERIDKENQRRAERAKRLADQAAARTGKSNFQRALRLDEFATKQALARNQAEEAAARALPDRAAREAELNRVLQERRKIYQDQAQRLEQIQRAQAAAGNDEHARKAEAAKLRAAENAGKVDVNQAKATADAQVAAQKEAENKRKEADAQAKANQTAAFRKELQDIKARSDMRIAAINAAERRERAAAKTAADRAAASAKAHQARVAEYQNRASQFGGVEGRARAAGFTGVEHAARGGRQASMVTAARDMQKFAAATTASGHALNFHSSALLRNAMTFMRWMVPVQAVLAATRAVTAGFSSALRVDRQFATLRAVFRGTDEEVQQLKKDTLDLAVAQGRSSDEAMDAAVRWSRLGLTRVQVNQAVRTSLMAANVAEIKAAEAAEKLSAIYATYRLNVGDLPVVLSRLNAISNRYNVTNKDLLEGIVRVAGVAKTSGMALRDLEGIIGAVTGATGRPGQEVGNALKFVITRLSAPETMGGLKKAFDIDLTDENGDLKDMSRIFRELADIYPTLNNAQRQYFLKLTAGSRQAARFALVLDQYRQAMILSAEAAFDTNSAFQENQKILESLQSRIESLKSAWADMWTSAADSGFFDWIEKRLRGIQGYIQSINVESQKMGKGQLQVNDPVMAELIENLSGSDAWFGTKDKFDQGDIEETVRRLSEQISEREKLREKLGNGNWIQKLLDGVLPQAESFSVYGKDGQPVKFENIDDAKKSLEVLQTLLSEGGDSGAEDRVAAMTNDVNMLRERISGLQYGAKVFESLGAAIKNGTADRQTMVRDFENGAHLLLSLDQGATRYNETLREFYAALESGDTNRIVDLADKVRMMFAGALRTDAPKLDAAIPSVVERLRAELLVIDREKRKLNDGFAGANDPLELRAHAENLEELQRRYKQVQQSIEQLTQFAERMKDTAFSFDATTGINQFFDDVLKQAELFSKAYENFAPDAENDPVERIFQRQRRTLRLGSSFLTGVRNATGREAQKRRNEANEKLEETRHNMGMAEFRGEDDEVARLRKEEEALQRIIAQQDEAVQTAKTRLREEQERIREMERELEIQEQIARLQRAQTDAARQAEISSAAWRFGETDSDKDANQAAAAIERAKRGLFQAESDAFFGTANPASKSARSGQILQDEATARAALESMERRQYELEAARKQVAIDTVRAMREQTEEASKRLMLATREDQLRAAALARTIRDKGPVKDREFFALGQETRQAFVNYLPNQVPDILNEAKVQAARTKREIDEESRRLSSSIPELRGALDALTKAITAQQGKGKALDVLPDAPKGSVQTAADKGVRDQSPIVNVNLGDFAITVKLHDQVERMLSGYVDRRLATELSAMERRLRATPAPNAQGVVE